MPSSLFHQNVIAMIWDFDQTMIPGYMQQPLFEHYQVDANTFWDEANALPAFYRSRGVTLVAKDTLYLNHMLTYVRTGKFRGLTNARLKELGAAIKFHPGLPDFLRAAQERIASNTTYREHDLKVEHYIVSTGLRQMICGSAVAPYVEEVYACEFGEGAAPPGFLTTGAPPPAAASEISELVYVIDHTSKTRAVFEINKGTNKDPQIDVNARVKSEHRRIPFENMIYIADGPSDVPVFSVVKGQGGRTYGVYPRAEEKGFLKAKSLQEQGRVDGIGEADYTPGTQTYMWLMASVTDIAQRLVNQQQGARAANVLLPPGHR